MKRKRSFFHGTVLLVAGVVSLVVLLRSPGFALGQQLGEGMSRAGIVGIENDTERRLFWGLICTCGCPHETLGTCTCSTAHERRDALRAQLSAGRTIEEITAAYAAQYGPEALAVPPNRGSQRLLYLFPLGAIVMGAGLVIVTLRRWKARSATATAAAREKPAAKGVAAGARDDYDEKLDEELKNLDRE